MKFSNWIKENKTDQSIELLEQIFLDIINSNLFENLEDDSDDDEVADYTPSYLQGDEDATPIMSDSGESDEKEVSGNRRKSKLVKDLVESMLMLRLKAKLNRQIKIKKLKKLSPSNPKSEELLRKLGYNTTNLAEAHSKAIQEKGNGIIVSRLPTLRSKSIKDFQNEFLTNLWKIYSYYGEFSPKRWNLDNLRGEIIEKMIKTITVRRVTSNNVAQDWSNPAPLVDKTSDAIKAYITTIIKSTESDEGDLYGKVQGRKKRPTVYGAAKKDEDEYSSAVANATKTTDVGLGVEDKAMTALKSLVANLDLSSMANKQKFTAYLISLGLDDLARELHTTGKINISDSLAFDPMFKTIKSGGSKNIDYDELIAKLHQNYGIQASKPTATSWINQMRDRMNAYFENRNFSKWLLIREG